MKEGGASPSGAESGARVLVVDDSPYARQVLRRILEADPLVASVQGAGNGQVALQSALRSPPDLVTLDLEMPVMDGFTFLRLFRRRCQAPVLVVSSHADLANVERALELGASGFVSKPENPYRDLEAIAAELRLKLRQHWLPAAGSSPPAARWAAAEGSSLPAFLRRGFPVVAIGCSSGGPPTLQYLLSGLPRAPRAAVLVAQHMPAGFTQAFARRLDTLLAVTVREAEAGNPVCPGEVLVAPGGSHLMVRGEGDAAFLDLVPAVGESCAPSVDHLFESAAQAFGPRLTAVVLTGMGRDGSQGVRRVKEAGGEVLAESEETAAIYGMPKQAAATGCVDRLLPLPELAVHLMRLWGEGGAEPAGQGATECAPASEDAESRGRAESATPRAWTNTWKDSPIP
jgi:two-component system chemotaxis response regulator CheB